MAYENLLHWSVIGKYHMLNLIFDYLRFFDVTKAEPLIGEKNLVF